MKTALLLSGHLRTADIASNNCYRNIIEPLDCDVYVSTWYENERSRHEGVIIKYDERTSNLHDLYDRGSGRLKSSSTSNYQSYRLSEPYRSVDFTNIGPGVDPERVLSMYYQIWKAWDLMEASGVSYDLVIRSRPDVFIGKDCNLNNKITEFDLDFSKINLPCPSMDCNDLYWGEGLLMGGLDRYNGFIDVFAIGPRDLMRSYCTIYGRIMEYCEGGCMMHPESLLEWAIRRSDSPAQETDLKCGILRRYH